MVGRGGRNIRVMLMTPTPRDLPWVSFERAMDPPRDPHAPVVIAKRQAEQAGNEKRVVKACVTAGFHVLRFSHQNRRIPTVHRYPSGLSRSAVGTRGKAGGGASVVGFSRTFVVPQDPHFIIHTASIGRPGLGWRFDRRVADPATWNLRRLTRLRPPHFSPLFMCVGTANVDGRRVLPIQRK